MKILNIIICFLTVAVSFAQEKLKISYQEFVNNEYPIQREEILLVDVANKKSIYAMDYTNQKMFDSKDGQHKLSEIGMQVDRIVDNNYIVFDLKNKKMEMFEDFGRRFYKINDAFPDLKWELVSNETKKINDIECKKAITHFRGSTWEVWYAPSIPLPFGPWKLHGLPGLILEAKDKEEKFYFIARSIEHNSSYVIDIPKSTIQKEISLKQYLLIQDDLYNNIPISSPGMIDLSEKFNFVKNTKEKEFEFPVEFSWEE